MTEVESSKTPAEWQAAVDAAGAFLVLESARLYGLVVGGPRVNVLRCEELLELGRARGFEPAPDAAERLLSELRPLSACCSVPVVCFHRAGRGRPSKHEGRPCCSQCGKWCDEESQAEERG